MAKKKTTTKKATKKTAKKTLAKKTSAKKAALKKVASKKATSKKATSKKVASKKAASKKVTSKKVASKKTSTKKVTAKKATKKAAAKKVAKKALASKRLRNKQSVKNIKRIDSTKTHGWQVHVRRGGVLKTKLFSDKIFKGKTKALVAAKEYRDALLDEMAKLAKPLWKIKRTPRTNTGHLGVSETEYTNKSGKKRKVITVTARESLGKAVNRKFSVDKLGREQAIKKAVNWRNKVLRERGKSEKD